MQVEPTQVLFWQYMLAPQSPMTLQDTQVPAFAPAGSPQTFPPVVEVHGVVPGEKLVTLFPPLQPYVTQGLELTPLLVSSGTELGLPAPSQITFLQLPVTCALAAARSPAATKGMLQRPVVVSHAAVIQGIEDGAAGQSESAMHPVVVVVVVVVVDVVVLVVTLVVVIVVVVAPPAPPPPLAISLGSILTSSSQPAVRASARKATVLRVRLITSSSKQGRGGRRAA
jgi:hypothetical protein